MPLFIFLSKLQSLIIPPSACIPLRFVHPAGSQLSPAMLAAADGEKYNSTKMTCQKESGKYISVLTCARALEPLTGHG
jgi:hypothetical protein